MNDAREEAARVVALDSMADAARSTVHAQRMLQRPVVQRVLQQEGINIWDKAA